MTDTDERTILKQKAQQLGVKGFGNMGVDKLKESIEKKLDELEGSKGQEKVVVGKPAEKVVKPKEEELYAFTDPKSGKIGLYRKTHNLTDIPPNSTDPGATHGQRQADSPFQFVRWHQ